MLLSFSSLYKIPEKQGETLNLVYGFRGSSLWPLVGCHDDAEHCVRGPRKSRAAHLMVTGIMCVLHSHMLTDLLPPTSSAPGATPQ